MSLRSPPDLGKNEHLRDQIRRLENLARGLQATVHMKNMTRDQFLDFASKWINHRAAPWKSSISSNKRSITPKKRSISPIKRSTPLKRPESPLKTNFEHKHATIMNWGIDRAQQLCTILPTEALKVSVQGTIPNLSIQSLDKLRALAVAEVMSDTWCSTGSIIDTWIAGAQKAEAVNLDILEGFHHCQHACVQTSQTYRLDTSVPVAGLPPYAPSFKTVCLAFATAAIAWTSPVREPSILELRCDNDCLPSLKK